LEEQGRKKEKGKEEAKRIHDGQWKRARWEHG